MQLSKIEDKEGNMTMSPGESMSMTMETVSSMDSMLSGSFTLRRSVEDAPTNAEYASTSSKRRANLPVSQPYSRKAARATSGEQLLVI